MTPLNAMVITAFMFGLIALFATIWVSDEGGPRFLRIVASVSVVMAFTLILAAIWLAAFGVIR